MNTRKRTAWTALATLLAVGLISCSANRTEQSSASPAAPNDTVSKANKGVVESDEKPTPGGKLVYGIYSETNGWNPGTNQWAPSGMKVTRAIFDTITAYDENSEIKPFLAESVEHNAAYDEWTVKLRPNVKLHNGKPVNADVVIRNQTYLSKSPVTRTAYSYAGITSLTKSDDLTFVVHVNKPSIDFPIFFATQLGVVADPDWLESNDGLKPIGSGPFSLAEWEIDKKLTVVKNNDYWQVDKDGTRLPYLDSIEFRVIPDTESRSKALLAKDVDVIETVSGPQLQSFQEKDDFQVYADAKGETREHMVQLNTMKPPFDDPDARLALAYATDRKAFSDIESGGYDEVADGPIAPNSPWYTKPAYPEFDPVKAKELVEKVKAKHDGKFEFRLQGVNEPEIVVGAQTLQQQWAAVGIDAKVDLEEQAKLIIEVVAGSYQSTLWHQFDAPNPIADGVWWDGHSSVAPPEFTLNFTRINDPALTDALQAAGKEPDAAKRKQSFAVVQERLAAQVPYVWLTHQRVSLIASKRVVNLVKYQLPGGANGLDLNQGGHSLAQIWLKD